MIIDAHAHVFPHQGGPSGRNDGKTHMAAVYQAAAGWLWGRMVTSTLDERFRPLPDEDVDFRIGRYGRWYWTKNGEECWLQRFPPMMVEIEWLPEQMLAFMNEIGVDMVVLQAGGNASGYIEINYCRKYFADCVKRWPDRFIGTVTIDYDISRSEKYREAELDKLREAVLNDKMRGVMDCYPRTQDPSDERFKPLWTELSRLRTPHIFFVGFQPKEIYLRSLVQLERLMRQFPALLGVVGHLGGNVRHPSDPNHTDVPNDMMRLLKLPNVYFEVGYMLAYENHEIWKENYEYPYPLHNEIIRKIYEEVGAERLLWSSDMPNTYRSCTYRQNMDLVRLHSPFLSEDEKTGVLGRNAARVFGITDGGAA